MPAGRITLAEARAIRAEYEGPRQPSCQRIADRTGWSAEAVRAAIKRAGGAMRTHSECAMKIPPDQGAAMRTEYEADPRLTFARMERKWGWGATAIRDAVIRAGGTPRRQGHVRVYVLPIPDAEVLAAREQGFSYRRLVQRYGLPARFLVAAAQRERRRLAVAS